MSDYNSEYNYDIVFHYEDPELPIFTDEVTNRMNELGKEEGIEFTGLIDKPGFVVHQVREDLGVLNALASLSIRVREIAASAGLERWHCGSQNITNSLCFRIDPENSESALVKNVIKDMELLSISVDLEPGLFGGELVSKYLDDDSNDLGEEE